MNPKPLTPTARESMQEGRMGILGLSALAGSDSASQVTHGKCIDYLTLGEAGLAREVLADPTSKYSALICHVPYSISPGWGSHFSF